MRKSPPIILAAIVSILAPTGLSGQDSADKPLTKGDLEEMLETIEKMSSIVRSKYHGRYRDAVQSFQSAAQTPVSAFDFYLKCQKKTRFDDQGKLASAFKGWKDGEEETHEDIQFRMALQMQLKYLILSLKAGLAEDDEDYVQLIPSIVSYLTDMSRMDGRAYEWLDNSATDSIFAETYELDRILILPDWESNPLEIGGIFESSILPHYRMEQRNPLLLSAWKTRIDLTTTVMEKRKQARDRRVREQEREARRQGRDTDRFDPRRRADNNIETERYEEFVETDLPELKWKMGKDLLAHGFEREAMSGMLALLRENESHPSVVDWIEDLSETLKERLGINQSAPGIGAASSSPDVAGSDASSGASN